MWQAVTARRAVESNFVLSARHCRRSCGGAVADALFEHLSKIAALLFGRHLIYQFGPTQSRVADRIIILPPHEARLVGDRLRLALCGPVSRFTAGAPELRHSRPSGSAGLGFHHRLLELNVPTAAGGGTVVTYP